MQSANINSAQNVNSIYGIFALKKANEMRKEGALKLIESVPLPKPLEKNKQKVDILA
jgi:hypothetical protein